MIERLAVWYLERRGRAVLPRNFMGFAVGFGSAIKQHKMSNGTTDVWEIRVPKNSDLIALNYSLVTTDDPVTYTVANPVS
jgi:hypothetical protein